MPTTRIAHPRHPIVDSTVALAGISRGIDFDSALTVARSLTPTPGHFEPGGRPHKGDLRLIPTMMTGADPYHSLVRCGSTCVSSRQVRDRVRSDSRAASAGPHRPRKSATIRGGPTSKTIPKSSRRAIFSRPSGNGARVRLRNRPTPTWRPSGPWPIQPRIEVFGSFGRFAMRGSRDSHGHQMLPG